MVLFGGGGGVVLFGGACVVLFGEGCAWFYLGGVHGFIWGGHVWFYLGGMRGFIWGACVVLFGGHMWFYSGACMVLFGGCMVLFGGCAWFFWGGVHGFFSFFGYNEIRSMSGRYASYWNAFLFYVVYCLLHSLLSVWETKFFSGNKLKASFSSLHEKHLTIKMLCTVIMYLGFHV